MSEQKMVTEREAVMRERAAYVSGIVFVRHSAPDGDADALADRRYPLPKVTRPRVVMDCSHRAALWRVVDGSLEVKVSSLSNWHAPDESWGYRAERVKLWADLFANPTEEADA